MKKLSFTISPREVGQRIDKFMVQQFKREKYSRAFLQKLIKEKNILVNQTAVKPSYKLKSGDVVKAEIIPPEKISLEPDPSIKLNIIYEDNNVIGLNKPAGLIVHPSQTHKKETLVNGLLAYYPAIKNVGEDLSRPGIVHRLDKDTSGLMMVAKNNTAFQFLKNQFQQRKVIKKYLTLISGRLKEKQGQISIPIGRAKTKTLKQTISPSVLRKEAITEYKVIKEYRDFSLVEVRPKTGRMHQIRVHFAALGHPVAGDQKYGFKKSRPLPDLKRQFLHAIYLKLKLPNKQIKEFKSNLPDDLKKTLTGLAKGRKS